MSEPRSFPGKKVNAVIVCKVVSLHFSENIEELSVERSNWTPQYATDLGKRIDTVSANYLGVKTRDELFKATDTLRTMLIPLKDDLATLRVNINADFAKNITRRNEILSKLGYVSGRTVSKITQPQLVEFLTTFKRELTASLLTEITAAGMNPEIPNRIKTSAPLFIEAHAVQEKLKTSTKEANDVITREINDLYNEVITICKVAADHFKREPVKKEMFTFSRIMLNLGEKHNEKKNPPAPPK